MTWAEEFAGTDFLLAVGEVYGLRGWMVRGGFLTAVYSDFSWAPGVNVAECKVEEYPHFWQPYSGLLSWNAYGIGWTFEKWNLTKKPKPHAGAPRENCRCGFYAYSDPKAMTVGSVEGIVRITGKTLIGTRGYRFERGEIVALLDPTHGGERADVPWRARALKAIQDNYPDVPLAESEEELLQMFPLSKETDD